MLEVIAFAVVFLVLSEVFATPRNPAQGASPRKGARKVTRIVSLPAYQALPGAVSDEEWAQARYWQYLHGAKNAPIPTQYEIETAPIR